MTDEQSDDTRAFDICCKTRSSTTFRSIISTPLITTLAWLRVRLHHWLPPQLLLQQLTVTSKQINTTIEMCLTWSVVFLFFRINVVIILSRVECPVVYPGQASFFLSFWNFDSLSRWKFIFSFYNREKNSIRHSTFLQHLILITKMFHIVEWTVNILF